MTRLAICTLLLPSALATACLNSGAKDHCAQSSDCLSGYVCGTDGLCAASSGQDAAGGTGSVSVTGTLGGVPPALQTAVSQIDTDGDETLLVVWLSPLADACGATGVLTPGEASLEFAFAKQGSSGLVAATDVGVYSTESTGGPGPYLEIDVFDRDSSCAPTSSEGKGTGTVTLTRADTTYAGTFDFTTGDDHLTGSFDTTACTWSDATTCP